jgi:hypothetical protein
MDKIGFDRNSGFRINRGFKPGSINELIPYGIRN